MPDFQPWPDLTDEESQELGVKGFAVDNIIAGYGNVNQHQHNSSYSARKCLIDEWWNSSLPYFNQSRECYADQQHLLSIRVGAAYSLAESSLMSAEEAASNFNPRCEDKIATVPVYPLGQVSLMYASVAEALNAKNGDSETAECPEACNDWFRPVCLNGSCVSPTCTDLMPFCSVDSVQGRVARLWCPVLCGCTPRLPCPFMMGHK